MQPSLEMPPAAAAEPSPASPPTRAAWFDGGNWSGVARHGDPDDWRTWAALGLVGKTDAALAGLERFGHEEARFHSGVASFIAGDDRRALAVLETVPTAHARNLCALVRKPRIRILAQMPWNRQGAQDYLTAASRSGRFEITNVSFDPRDRRNAPYADARTFVDPDAPPDFYVAIPAEWHLLPPNLRALGCPILGQISDYDLHVQVLHPWLPFFDELVITDETEWADVQGLAPARFVTFPKCQGVPEALPPLETGERPIDVVFSGTVVHPYNWEKAVLVRQLLELSDAKLKIVNGHLWYPTYLKLLAQSKLTFTHQRRPGSATTRGLEALAMGCGMLVQRGSVLDVFLREETDGIFPCDLDGGALAPTLRRLLAEWDRHAGRAATWAAVVRREFAMERVALEYLRFLTVLAARPRPPRPAPPPAPVQKRAILWKGPMQLPPEVTAVQRELNLQRWAPRVTTDLTALVDLAREVVLDAVPQAQSEVTRATRADLLTRVLETSWRCAAQFPDSIVLRFDLIRGAIHCGRPEDVRRALDRAAATLAEPPARWRVRPDEDVMPFDFAPMFFDYRRYLDLVIEHVKRGTAVEAELVALVRAALHHYLGRYTGDVAHLDAAVRLAPGFAFYGLALAGALVERGAPGDDARAGAILEPLAAGSVVFGEALELLGFLHEAGRRPVADPVRFARLLADAMALVSHEDQRLGVLRPARLDVPALGFRSPGS